MSSSILQRLGTWLDTRGGAARMKRFAEGWPASSRRGIRFYRTPLVQYRYLERAGPDADAPTIVFAADPPATVEFYDELLNLFSKRFRVIVMELPAMGFSASEASYNFDFRQTNDDVAMFLRAVAGPNNILAFSCVATLAAIDIADRYPELVSRLVLIQGGSVEAFARWKAARDPKGILARPVLGQLAMSKMAPKRMPDWYKLSAGKREMIQPFCDCAHDTLQRGALWPLASAYQVYMHRTVELSRPKQPMLGIWGAADRSHPDGNMELCRVDLGLSEEAFVVHSVLGHAPEVEDPQAIFDDIARFMELVA
ncbi:MAG: alpha/beta hydrolase [Pseudomonadota bacterium]